MRSLLEIFECPSNNRVFYGRERISKTVYTIRKKENLNLHALNRISRVLSPEQRVLIINAYMKSLQLLTIGIGCSAFGGLCIN